MSDVPSSSFCTNWAAFNTPRLWSMVEHEDSPEAWAQVTAWGRIADSVAEQRVALTRARYGLTAAWPPEHSEASRTFLAQLDTLLARMQAAQEDASTTLAALANILQALRRAKREIEPLWREYEKRRDDAVPAWWDHAEDELDRQAQAYMIAAERTVEEYVPLIKVPVPYQMRPPQGRGDSDRGEPGGPADFGPSGSGPTTSRVPVPHDPPPPIPGHDPTIPDRYHPDGPVVLNPPQGPDAPGRDVPGPEVPGPDGPGSPTAPPTRGPDLTEFAPPPSPPVSGASPHPPVAPAPVGQPPGLTGGLTGGPGFLPVTGGLPPVGGLPQAGGGGLRPFAGGARAALPSGAVIGGAVPMGGVGAPGARPAGKPTPPAWLPGSLGQSGPARTGGATAPGGMAGMPGAVRRGRSDDDRLQFDPDNPWAVTDGVDPVIEPSQRHPRHDPGPGVIGWHG